MRETLSSSLKTAMKAGDKRRVETIRLINAAVKEKEIDARTTGAEVGDPEILALLQKMVKSRQESLDIFRKAGRDDLADREAEEIAIIQTFLPQPMSDDETNTAVEAAIASAGATSIKDMGKVVAALKTDFAGRMDFAKASARVKARLTA